VLRRLPVKLIHGLDCTKAMPTSAPTAPQRTPVSSLRVVPADHGNYAALQNELSDLRERVERVSGPTQQGQLRTLIAQNAASIEFWTNHCQVDATTFPELETSLQNLDIAHGALVRLVERKLGAPLEAITEPPELAQAAEQFARLEAAVVSYNSGVSAANGAIGALKAATAVTDLATAQAELSVQRG
jgi:hypothetical protein